MLQARFATKVTAPAVLWNCGKAVTLIELISGRLSLDGRRPKISGAEDTAK